MFHDEPNNHGLDASRGQAVFATLKWLMMESMVSKTLVAWVIYGMTSYPVVQGLFHETINGCQVIQAVTFFDPRSFEIT